MPVREESQKNVYYLGEVECCKKWVLDHMAEDNDDKKMILLSLVKQVFDSQVYKGPRCNADDCATKGKCPRNRALNIILVKRTAKETEETVFRSIMIHAYKTGDDLEEAVFEKHIARSGNPFKIEFNALGVAGGQSSTQLQNMVKGEFAEVEDAEQISEMKEIMKKALEDDCPAEVMALQSEGYEEQ